MKFSGTVFNEAPKLPILH